MFVLYIASLAQGGGDLAFAVRMCEHINHELRNQELFENFRLIVVIQAGRNPRSVLQELLDFSEGHVKHAGDVARAIKCADVFERCSSGLVTRSSSQEQQRTRPATLVIQGPLFVFHSPSAIALDYPVAHSARMLTVREFGQARFCSPLSLLHADCSSGVDEDEVGIWRVEANAFSPMPTIFAGLPIVVGYFRTLSHALQLGRLVGSSLTLLSIQPNTHGVRTMVVLMPDDVGYIDRMLSGLRDHPAIESVEPEQPRKVDSNSNSSSSEKGPYTVRSQGGLLTRVKVLDLLALRLTPSDFRSVLQNALACVVCGDGSLAEAIGYSVCTGMPYWYSADGHKIFTGQALDKIVFSSSTDSSDDVNPVRCLWRFIMSGFVEHWTALVEGHDEASLRAGFRALGHRILDRKGIERMAGGLLPPPCGDLGAWLSAVLPILLMPPGVHDEKGKTSGSSFVQLAC